MAGSWIFSWEIWVSLGAGVGVCGLVIVFGGYFRLGRRRTPSPCEEDLPWEDLLELLKKRAAAAGKSNELSAGALLEALLAELPKSAVARTGVNWAPEAERRRSKRRWANPVEVVLISPFHDKPLHGLVINRSTGGLAILTDVPFDPDTIVAVRAVDAPNSACYVDLCVRHAREVSKLWVIGCQYRKELPWNVKVWFG
jgi:hypothetical protein